MVSLVDIYAIKEKTFNKVNELKKFGNPARGDKAKDREELEQIGEDREEKVINWFKNIFKGE